MKAPCPGRLQRCPVDFLYRCPRQHVLWRRAYSNAQRMSLTRQGRFRHQFSISSGHTIGLLVHLHGSVQIWVCSSLLTLLSRDVLNEVSRPRNTKLQGLPHRDAGARRSCLGEEDRLTLKQGLVDLRGEEAPARGSISTVVCVLEDRLRPGDVARHIERHRSRNREVALSFIAIVGLLSRELAP